MRMCDCSTARRCGQNGQPARSRYGNDIPFRLARFRVVVGSEILIYAPKK